MKRKLILFTGLLFLTGLSLTGNAQPLSAYVNFQNYLMVWDNGITRRTETLPPVKIEIGRNGIAYLDNSNNFKIYYRGGASRINEGFTNSFQTTDNLITFQNANSLNVWENGKITNLSRLCSSYLVGDSVVLFFDGIAKESRAYYHGGIYPIEGFLAAATSQGIFDTSSSAGSSISASLQIASGQLPSVKVSDNIIAYVNYANQFHIFYHGEILDQESYLIDNFDVGRNTVAYVDINSEFKIFHDGKTYPIENFAPQNYATGDDLTAFVSNDGYFKIFYKDSVYDIGFFQPTYLVKDNVVCFEDQSGRFKVFYKGQTYDLDNYYPGNSNIVAGYNSVAYIDRGNDLRLFSDGQIQNVTGGGVTDWRLDYDVLQYRFGTNMYKIFYQGRSY